MTHNLVRQISQKLNYYNDTIKYEAMTDQLSTFLSMFYAKVKKIGQV